MDPLIELERELLILLEDLDILSDDRHNTLGIGIERNDLVQTSCTARKARTLCPKTLFVSCVFDLLLEHHYGGRICGRVELGFLELELERFELFLGSELVWKTSERALDQSDLKFDVITKGLGLVSTLS